MKRLGVNIDHVATLRNARGEFHPDPFFAASFIKNQGADSITIHLREDRRHIKDLDVKKICSIKNLLVNLEISIKKEIVKNALKIKPNYICVVPENRKEITTEGGLNLKKNHKKINKILKILNSNKIRTSLFINASLQDVKLSKKMGTDCIELHTGKLADLIKRNKNYKSEILKIKLAAQYATELGIEVHAGHGMDYKTTKILSNIKNIKEFNIGHFIIGESIFDGLKKVLFNLKKSLK